MKKQSENIEVLPMDMGEGSNPAGQVCLANEARFTAKHYSEPLTAYTTGWKDPENLEALVEQLFPGVQVGRRFEFKSGTNAEYFLSETDDVRAIGGSFKRVEYTGTSVNERTYNKGLTVRVDKDEELDDSYQQRTVGMLMQRLLRNDLRRGLALLAANNTNTGVTFSTATNPDNLMRLRCKAFADATGMWPNTMALGQVVWQGRAAAYEGQDTPYAGVAAAMTREALAAKLGLDKVVEVKARYQSTASAKAVALASLGYVYQANSGVGKDDPSSVKRFWSAARAGGKWGVYVVDHEKFVDISVEQYSNIVMTSTLGVQQLTVTVS
jgi:hypothetical protein